MYPTRAFNTATLTRVPTETNVPTSPIIGVTSVLPVRDTVPLRDTVPTTAMRDTARTLSDTVPPGTTIVTRTISDTIPPPDTVNERVTNATRLTTRGTARTPAVFTNRARDLPRRTEVIETITTPSGTTEIDEVIDRPVTLADLSSRERIPSTRQALQSRATIGDLQRQTVNDRQEVINDRRTLDDLQQRARLPVASLQSIVTTGSSLERVRINIFSDNAQVIETHSVAPECIDVDTNTSSHLTVRTISGKQVNYAASNYPDYVTVTSKSGTEYRGRMITTAVDHSLVRLTTEDGGTVLVRKPHVIARAPYGVCNMFLTDLGCRDNGPVTVSYTTTLYRWKLSNELYVEGNTMRYNRIAKIQGKINYDVPVEVYLYPNSEARRGYRLFQDDLVENYWREYVSTDEASVPYRLTSIEKNVAYQRMSIEELTLTEGINYKLCYLLASSEYIHNRSMVYGYEIELGRDIYEEEFSVYRDDILVSQSPSITTLYNTKTFVELGVARRVTGEITTHIDGYYFEAKNTTNDTVMVLIKLNINDKRVRFINVDNYRISRGSIIMKYNVNPRDKVSAKIDVQLE